MSSQSKNLRISQNNSIIPEPDQNTSASKRLSQSVLDVYFDKQPSSSNKKRLSSSNKPINDDTSFTKKARPIPIEHIEANEQHDDKETMRQKSSDDKNIEVEGISDVKEDNDRTLLLKTEYDNTIDRYFVITEISNQPVDSEKGLKLVAQLKVRQNSERKASIGSVNQNNKINEYYKAPQKKTETGRKSVLKKKAPGSSVQKKNTKKILIQTPEKHLHGDEMSEVKNASIKAKKASSYKRQSGAFCYTYEIAKAPVDIENDTGKRHIITPVKHSRRIADSKHLYNSIDQKILENGDYIFMPNENENLEPLDDKTKKLKSLLHRKATPYKSGKQIEEEPELIREADNNNEETTGFVKLDDDIIHKVIDPHVNARDNYAVVSLSKKGERKYGSKNGVSPLKKFNSAEGKLAKEDLEVIQKRYGDNICFLPLNHEVVDKVHKLSKNKE